MKRILCFTLIAFLIFSTNNLNAQNRLYANSDKIEVNNNNKEIADSTNSINLNIKDSIIAEFNDSVEIYIVILSSDPIAVVKQTYLKSTNSILTSLERIEEEQEKFISDIQTIESSNISNSGLKSAKSITTVEAQYKIAINGFAIKTKKWVADKIAELNYVQGIYKNYSYQIDIDKNTELHVANDNQLNIEYTGKGIVVGIMDTGIDYMHPDLGGGIGLEYKVISGKNLIDGGSPLDNNGHGTHVAGIIAANGKIKGVAPDAKLVSIKVADENGNSDSNKILQGIEYALNPDNNPLTDDAVDILNISMSGSVDAFGGMSEIPAIDNAIKMGVICISSAGNTGPEYKTVRSPGIIPDVIAVGASDEFDKIAPFSSKGPSPSYLQLKPDISAPGVQVNSTWLNGAYEVKDGTSMAAPYISGACAVILEQHPDWTPEIIKACLMNNAKDIGFDAWSQGAGKMDLQKSLEASLISIPGSISLGLQTESGIFKDSLYLFNTGNVNVNFEISLSLNSPLGLKADFSPKTGLIKPGEKFKLVFTLDISDIQQNEVKQQNWLPYSGAFNINSGGNTISVNFSFIKHPYLKVISANSFFYQPIIFNDKGAINPEGIYSISRPDLKVDNSPVFFVENGVYNVFLCRDNSFLALENIEVNPVNTISLDDIAIPYSISYQFVDENNNENPMFKRGDFGVFNIFYNDTMLLYSNNLIAPNITNSFSELSDRFSMVYRIRNYASNKKVYYYNGIIKELNKSQVISNNPSDLRKLSYDFSRSKNDYFEIGQFAGDFKFAAGELLGDSKLTPSFFQELFITPEISEKNKSPEHFYREAVGSNLDVHSILPDLRFRNGNWEFYFMMDSKKKILSYSNERIINQLGPSHFYGRFKNESNEMILLTNSDKGYGPYFFLNQFQDYKTTNYPYQLLDENGGLIHSGNLNWGPEIQINPYYLWHFPIALPYPGYYSLSITDTSSIVFEKKSNVYVNSAFNTNKKDKNPPSLTSLNIEVNNVFTDIISSYQSDPKIRFVIEDDYSLQNVGLFIKKEEDSTWIEIPTIQEDSLFTGNIHNWLPKGFNGYMDLKLFASDSSENFLKQVCSPGFYYRSDTINILGLQNVCTGDDPIEYSVPEMPGIQSYKWSYSGYGATITNNFTNKVHITFSENASSGNLSVLLTNDDGLEYPSDDFTITVNQTPEKPKLTFDGENILSSSFIGNQWYNKDPMMGMVRGANDQIFTPSYDGRYYVKVKKDGCISPPSNSITFGVPTNRSPVAVCGANQIVNEESLVELNGMFSFDPEEDSLNFYWTAPTGILLSETKAGKPTFTAPEVSINTDYTFTLVVNDGTFDSPADEVVITVLNVNKAPIANAGLDQSVNAGTTISLDGSSSSDPDGNTLTYNWTAPAGITLSSTSTVKPTFTAPEVTSNTSFIFSLIVNDGITDSKPDSVSIFVLDDESCLRNDSLALVAFYNATGGTNWTRNDNWLTGPVNTWYGVTVNDCNVTEIQLLANNLTGTLPPEIGNLKELKVLSLADNLLTGNIPVEIGQLTNLTYLRCWNNQLTGNIPAEISQLINLTTLDFSHNQLTGSIPFGIWDLTQLETLGLTYNQLSGTIPSEVSQLINLKSLYLGQNQLSGVIPVEIGQLFNLKHLTLNGNQLSGILIPELGQLINLAVLDISGNQLTGHIPVEIGALKKLSTLILQVNQLSGPIPREIGLLTDLSYVCLSYNHLSGNIPAEIGQLINLTALTLNDNLLTGEIPAEIGLLSKLEHLLIENNFIEEMPVLPDIDIQISCANNLLTFEDLERNLDKIGKEGLSFSYNPQQMFGREYDTITIEGFPVTLNIPCGGKYNHYQWFKDGIEIPSVQDASKLVFPTIQLSDSGFYHVLVTNDSVPNLWLQSKSVKLSVKLNLSPIANAGSDQSINEGVIVNLDGSLSSDPDGNPLTYKWTAPAGIMLSSTSAAKPTFTAPDVTDITNYIFKLVVNDGYLYSQGDTVMLTVKPVYIINENKSICNGQSYNGWTTSGTYQRTLQTKAGCDSIVTTVLTVNPTYSISENKSICSGESYFEWTTSGTYQRTLQTKAGCDSVVTTVLTVNPTYSITEDKTICNGQSYNGWTTSGTYKRTLQTNAGCDSIVTTNLTVNPAFQPTIINMGDTLKSIEAYQSYQWFDDKGILSGATSNQYVIGKSGKYHLEIKDNNGCTQTSAELSVVYSDAITTNLPGFKYAVIPNPNTGKFTFMVNSKPQGTISLHLVNPLGQTVEKRELRYMESKHIEQFDISHLSKGMYHLIIQSDNGQKSEKIIVQ